MLGSLSTSSSGSATQYADDVLPPPTDHVRALMRCQARHLRIAMQSAAELEGAWKRVQIEMAGQLEGVEVVNIGDGNFLQEVQAANRALRSQVSELQERLRMEKQRNLAVETALVDSANHVASGISALQASSSAGSTAMIMTSELRASILSDLESASVGMARAVASGKS